MSWSGSSVQCCFVPFLQESTLPLDAACDPVHAWRFNQANTIFQVRSSSICILTPATVVLQWNFTILGAQLDIDNMSHTVCTNVLASPCIAIQPAELLLEPHQETMSKAVVNFRMSMVVMAPLLENVAYKLTATSTSGTAFLCMQVALAAGKRTAWIDKGPYYEVVQVKSYLPV